MPTEQDVRDYVRRQQSIGSQESMERAAVAERELERSTLDDLRASGDDSPEREALEKAYPKRKPAPATAGGGGGGGGSDADETRDDLLRFKREDLENKARAAGVSDVADREQFPNKETLADALIEARKE